MTGFSQPTRHHYHAAIELEISFRHGRLPALDHATPHEWALACHEFFDGGRLDIAEYAARYLHPIYPELEFLSTLVALFDAVPDHLPPAAPFRDDPDADIQVVHRPDAEAVVLCFCARQGTLGLPLNFVHHWLGRLPASLVYLKDFRNLGGALGYPSLGGDRQASVGALRRMSHDLGATRFYALGVSFGGYAALHYGLQIGAEAVLSLAGWTDLTRDSSDMPIFDVPFGQRVRDQAPDYACDLQISYAAAERRPRALLAFSAGYPHDRRQAERMARLPGVELVPVRDYSRHNVVDPLIRRREFLPLLLRLISERADTKSA